MAFVATLLARFQGRWRDTSASGLTTILLLSSAGSSLSHLTQMHARLIFSVLILKPSSHASPFRLKRRHASFPSSNKHES